MYVLICMNFFNLLIYISFTQIFFHQGRAPPPGVRGRVVIQHAPVRVHKNHWSVNGFSYLENTCREMFMKLLVDVRNFFIQVAPLCPGCADV